MGNFFWRNRKTLQEEFRWPSFHLELYTSAVKYYDCHRSVTKLCPTLCDPMDCSTPGFPVLHHLLEFAQIPVHWVSDAIQHLILCHPLLILPSIFPSSRVFSIFSILWLAYDDRWKMYFCMAKIQCNSLCTWVNDPFFMLCKLSFYVCFLKEEILYP